jgi:hypothetical protein
MNVAIIINNDNTSNNCGNNNNNNNNFNNNINNYDGHNNNNSNNSSYSDLDSNFLNYYFLKSFGMIFFNSSFNIYLFLKLNLVIFLDWMLQV